MGTPRSHHAADAGHPARLHPGRGRGDRAHGGTLPRSRRGRGRAGRPGEGVPARALRGRLPTRPGASASGPCRTPARSLDPRRSGSVGRARCRPAAARHPRGGRSGARGRARGARIVLDVCLTSNVFTGAVASLEEHPLPQLMAAGVLCTLNTDDPAFFGTDLGHDTRRQPAWGCHRVPSTMPVWRARCATTRCVPASRRSATRLTGRRPGRRRRCRPGSALDGTAGDAAHEVALEPEEDEQRQRHRDEGRRHEVLPVAAERGAQVGEDDGQREVGVVPGAR